MAEIEIERRPRRSPLTWIALLLVLSAVALGAWLMLRDDTGGAEAAPAAETTRQPMGPSSWTDELVPGGEPVFAAAAGRIG